MRYTKWVVQNTNSNEFMVYARQCGTDSLWRIYKTFEEAYRSAKAYGFGAEPIDETRHH